jgi:predicted PurR-regulated permease PerM
VRRLRSVRTPLRVLMLLAIAVALVLAKDLLIPLVLAAFIALALNPVVAGLARWHIPRAVGSLTLMLALGAAIGAGIAALSGPAAGWMHEAPAVLREIGYRVRHMTRPLTEVSHAASLSLARIGVGAPPAAPRAAMPGAFSFNDVVHAAPGILAAVLTVALLVFFFLTYGDSMRNRVATASPTFGYRRIALRVVRGIQVEISRYLLTVTVINVCLGLATAAILWAFKMPDPLLWGGLVTLLNYMPYVGAITNTLLLLVVGFLHFRAPLDAIAPAACFAVLAALEGNVVTPMIMGNRLRLSPVAILVWLLLWGWMWGIPGALLAVPMLTCLKLITEWLPGWQWFAKMVAR